MSIPEWPADEPTAKEIDLGRAELKKALCKTVEDLVDGLAAQEHKIAEYELEIASLQRACQTLAQRIGPVLPEAATKLEHLFTEKHGIERYTSAHFDLAAKTLVAQFIQVNPPNFLDRAVMVEDVENGLYLLVTVSRGRGPTPGEVASQKTAEAAKYRAALEEIFEYASRFTKRGVVGSEVARMAHQALGGWR